jgi:hypothetical protein
MRPLELRGSDGVTSRPRDGVTSDVIGHLPAETSYGEIYWALAVAVGDVDWLKPAVLRRNELNAKLGRFRLKLGEYLGGCALVVDKAMAVMERPGMFGHPGSN